MWHFHINQNEILVEVQIRPTDDLSTGFISARKRLEFHPLRVAPATVKMAFYVNHNGPGFELEETKQLIEWLQLAHRLAGHLDELIKEPGDFKKKYGAKQYNPNSWVTAFVELVKEWVGNDQAS